MQDTLTPTKKQTAIGRLLSLNRRLYIMHLDACIQSIIQHDLDQDKRHTADEQINN